MLIITVETRAAFTKTLDGSQPIALLDLQGVTPVDGEREEAPARDSRSAVLHLEGTLQTPVDVVLRSRVELLLHGGARRVVLDLSGVADIDASGVGELVHIFKTVAAAGGALEIGRTSPRVRRVLDVAEVLELLTAGAVR